MKLKTMAWTWMGVALLCSCGNGGSASTEDPSGEASSSSEASSIYSIDPETVTEVCSGHTDGYLIDIEVNSYLSENRDYECSFTPRNLDPAITVRSSNPEYLSVEMDPDYTGVFTLHSHIAGDAVLSIYDVEEVLVYRHIVRVRPAYEPETIGQALYDYDVYGGYAAAGHHRLTFIESNPIVGVLEGSDDVETGIEITFTASFGRYVPEVDKYLYNLTIDSANEGSQTPVSLMFVTPTADSVLIYYSLQGEDALLNIFFPKELESLHPDIY